MRGGTFNQVICIDVFGADPINPSCLILRVPRFEDAFIDHEVAVLRYVSKHTKIPAPGVVVSDPTTENTLNNHYMI